MNDYTFKEILDAKKRSSTKEIEQDLETIVSMAVQTRDIFGRNESYELPNSGDVSMVQKDYVNACLLFEILNLLMSVEKISTKNNNSALSKKETSYQYIKRIKNVLETRNQKDIKKIKKMLADHPLIPYELYSVNYWKDKNGWARNVLDYYYGYSSKHRNDFESAKLIAKNNATNMQTSSSRKNNIVYTSSFDSNKPMLISSSYVHEEGAYYPLKRNCKDIVDAALYYSLCRDLIALKSFKQLMNVRFEQVKDNVGYELKTLEEIKKNIDSKYKGLVSSQDIQKLKLLYDEKFKYLKSKMLFNKIIEFLKERNQIYFSDIIIKMNKEVEEFDKIIEEIQKRIDSLVKEFDKKIEKDNSKKRETTKRQNNIRQKVSNSQVKTTSSINDKKVEDSTNSTVVTDVKTKELIKDTVTERKKIEEEKKTFSQEEIDKYNKYVEIRVKLDNIVKRKNQYRNEEMFQQEIINTFYNLGNSYEEIIRHIDEMREELEVTKIIHTIILNSYEEFYNNPNQMREIDTNGLTKLENKIRFNISGILANDKTIPDELREELRYYLNRFHELEDDLKPVINWPKDEIWNGMADDNRLMRYFNTCLIEELGLTKRKYNELPKKPTR